MEVETTDASIAGFDVLTQGQSDESMFHPESPVGRESHLGQHGTVAVAVVKSEHETASVQELTVLGPILPIPSSYANL